MSASGHAAVWVAVYGRLLRGGVVAHLFGRALAARYVWRADGRHDGVVAGKILIHVFVTRLGAPPLWPNSIILSSSIGNSRSRC